MAGHAVLGFMSIDLPTLFNWDKYSICITETSEHSYIIYCLRMFGDIHYSDSTISFLLPSCSYINQRNRMNNIRQAEEAMRKEYEESRNAAADPFTRQACRPVLATKKKGGEVGGAAPARKDSVDEEMEAAMKAKAAPVLLGKPNKEKETKTEDLFSVHDFDIKIDLNVPLPTG